MKGFDITKNPVLGWLSLPSANKNLHVIHARAVTENATPLAVNIPSMGEIGRMHVPENTAFALRFTGIKWNITDSVGTAAESELLTIHRGTGNGTLLGASSTDFVHTIDNTAKVLRVTVTGTAGKTIMWCITYELVAAASSNLFTIADGMYDGIIK